MDYSNQRTRKYTKAGLSFAVAALLGVATYNYADNTPADSELANLYSQFEDNELAELSTLTEEEFEAEHEKAMERLKDNMSTILNMGTTALDAGVASRCFGWIRANQEEYNRVGTDLNFTALIEDMERQTN